MSKTLLINGSPREHGCTAIALEEVAGALAADGVETETLWLGTKPMQDCIACGKCSETGTCVFKDIVSETAARFDEFDGLVVGSPVYYSGPTGRLQSFMDRFFYSTPASKLEGKLAACVVSCRRGGATASFERLNQFFLISNMMVVGSQYWNLIHGPRADQVEQDLEGLQTMRTLGHNMAWMLKMQEAGKAAGIQAPEREAKLFTNFNR